MAFGRRIGAVNTVAIALARLGIGKIPVPDLVGVLGQVDAGFVALFVEQAQLDTRGMRGKQREIGALAVEDGTAWNRRP